MLKPACAPALKSAMTCGGIFDVEAKQRRLQELELSASNPEMWQRPEEMQKINKERSLLDKTVGEWNKLNSRIEDAGVLLEMVTEENDEDSFTELKSEIDEIEKLSGELELKKLLDGELDANNAFLSINSGAGGTEACDWAGMLMRMYMPRPRVSKWKFWK